MRNSESISSFKNNIQKPVRPKPKSGFDCHNPKGMKLITRLNGGISLRRNFRGVYVSPPTSPYGSTTDCKYFSTCYNDSKNHQLHLTQWNDSKHKIKKTKTKIRSKKVLSSSSKMQSLIVFSFNFQKKIVCYLVCAEALNKNSHVFPLKLF